MTEHYPKIQTEYMGHPLDIYEMTKDIINDHPQTESIHPNSYIEALEGYWYDLWNKPAHVNTSQDWFDHMMTNSDPELINSPMYYAITFELDRPADSLDFTDAIRYINDFQQMHVNYFTLDNYLTLTVNASMQVTPAMILLLSQATIADTLNLNSSNFIYNTIDTINEKHYYDLYQKGQDQHG